MASFRFQSTRRATMLVLAAALAALASCGPQSLQSAPAPTGYSVVDLGSMAESLLNDAGEVAGNRDTPRPFPAPRPAYFWKAGARVPRKLPHQLTHGLGSVRNMSRALPTRILLDASFTVDGPYYLWDGRNRVEAVTPWRVPTLLLDMNSAGDVVGALEYQPEGLYYNSFIKKHGQTAQLVTPLRFGEFVFADAINDHDEVGGTEYDQASLGTGVFWDETGTPHEMGLPTGPHTYTDLGTTRVSNRIPAELVGYTYWTDPDTDRTWATPYYWTLPGGFRLLDPPLPADFNLQQVGVDINDQGLVVLTAVGGSGFTMVTRTFTWSPATGIFTDLSPAGVDLCRAQALNDRGEVVLQVGNRTEPPHYQLWTRDAVQDLGPLFPSNTTGSMVRSINNRSQILGQALVHTTSHGYLFTPRGHP